MQRFFLKSARRTEIGIRETHTEYTHTHREREREIEREIEREDIYTERNSESSLEVVTHSNSYTKQTGWNVQGT